MHFNSDKKRFIINQLSDTNKSFHPLTITELNRWYSSTSVSNFSTSTNNGSLVIDEWLDRIGNDNATISSGTPYEGCAFFRSSDTGYTSDPNLGTSDFSVFVSGKYSTIGARSLLSSTNSGGTIGYWIRMTTGNEVMATLYFSGTNVTLAVSISSFGNMRYSNIFLTADRDGDAVLTVYDERGNLIGSDSADISTYSAVDFGHGENTLIARDLAGTDILVGYIREIMIFKNKVLGSGDITNIQNWYKIHYSPLAPDDTLLSPYIFSYHDASDSSTITESGGVVSAISDKGPNGYDLSQNVVARRPEVVSASQNGLDTITCAGDPFSGLIRSGMTAPSGFGNSILAVFKFVTGVNSGEVYGIGRAYNTTHGHLNVIAYNTGTEDRNGVDYKDGSRKLNVAAMASLPQWSLVGSTLRGKTNGNVGYVYRTTENSTSAWLGQNTSTDGDGYMDALGSSPNDQLAISANAQGSFNSEFGEAVIYTGFVPIDYFFRVAEYLRDKWGLS